jgi:uncharacterized heparinase superfamily protein
VGVHYISAMECALRILAVTHALDRARAHLTRPDEVWAAAVRLVGSHAYLIQRRLSLYSSAGNHTIAEAVGLVYAGVLFPEMPEAGRWVATGRRLLEQEAPRQVLPDGSGVEQAFWYLLFVTDLLGLATELLRSRGHAPPLAAVEAFHRGREFLQSFATEPERLPRIGDSDDGYALSPALRLSWSPRTVPERPRTVAGDGYTLLRGEAERPFEVIVDHGPLGMAPSYGHGHADALSVLLRVADEEVLIDTGTFSYTGDARWRRYFRSTRAHNTVVVDGRDQAKQETAFMWSKPYLCEVVLRDSAPCGASRILARHDGYSDLGVTHWRGVVVTAQGEIGVWDHLSGAGAHDVELNWHVGVPVTLDTGGYLLRARHGAIRLQVEGHHDIRVHTGAEDEQLGWCSKRYGTLEPITTISASSRASLPFESITQIGAVREEDRDGLDEHLSEFRRLTGADVPTES